MKKVRKNTRPFRYDLNQIPYDYTVEVTNQFKELDLIDRAPEELWTEVRDIVQEAVIKPISKKKKFRNAKWLSEEALQVVVKRRKTEGKNPRVKPLFQLPMFLYPSVIRNESSYLHILLLLPTLLS